MQMTRSDKSDQHAQLTKFFINNRLDQRDGQTELSCVTFCTACTPHLRSTKHAMWRETTQYKLKEDGTHKSAKTHSSYIYDESATRYEQ